MRSVSRRQFLGGGAGVLLGAATGTLAGCGGGSHPRSRGPDQLLDITSFTSSGQFVPSYIGGAEFVADQSAVEFDFNLQAVQAGGCGWVFSIVVGTNGGHPLTPMVAATASGTAGGLVPAPGARLLTPTKTHGQVIGTLGNSEGTRSTQGRYVLSGLHPGSTYTVQIMGQVISYSDSVALPAAVRSPGPFYLDQASDNRTIILCAGGTELLAVTGSWKPRWSQNLYQDGSTVPPGESPTKMYTYQLPALPPGTDTLDVCCSRTSPLALVTGFTSGTATVVSALTTTVTGCTFSAGQATVPTARAAQEMVRATIEGPGIPADTTVVAAAPGASLTLSNPPSTSGTLMTAVIRPTVLGTTASLPRGVYTVMCCVDDSDLGRGNTGWVTASNGRVYPVNLPTHQMDPTGLPFGAPTDVLAGVVFAKTNGAPGHQLWVCNASKSALISSTLARTGTTSSQLQAGKMVDSLPCTPTAGEVPAGTAAYIQDPGLGIQVFTISTTVPMGSTSIPVAPQSADYSFPPGSDVIVIVAGRPVALPAGWLPYRLKASGDGTVWVGAGPRSIAGPELKQISSTGAILKTFNADTANHVRPGTYGQIQDIAISEAATPLFPHGGAGLFWFSTTNAGGIDCITLEQWYPPPQGLAGGTGGVSHDGNDYIFWIDNNSTPKKIGQWMGGVCLFNQTTPYVGSATLIANGGSKA